MGSSDVIYVTEFNKLFKSEKPTADVRRSRMLTHFSGMKLLKIRKVHLIVYLIHMMTYKTLMTASILVNK